MRGARVAVGVVLSVAVASPAWGAGGDVDAVLEPDLPVTADTSSFADVAVDGDGRVLAAGNAAGSNAVDGLVARFTAEGEPDETFGDGGATIVDLGGTDLVSRVVPDGDDALVLALRVATTSFSLELVLARVLQDGTLDTGFGEDGVVAFGDPDAELRFTLPGGLVRAPDGRIVVGYTDLDDRGEPIHGTVTRLLPDGSVDPTFGPGGTATIEGEVGALTIDTGSDGVGRILATGTVDGLLSVTRLLMTGQVDPTYGEGGTALVGTGGVGLDIATADDGGAVVAGQTLGGNGIVAALDPLGMPVDGFGLAGVRTIGRGRPGSQLGAIAVDADGGVVLLEIATDAVALRRLQPDGRTDAGFGDGGVAVVPELAAAGRPAVQAAGRLLLPGQQQDRTAAVAEVDVTGTDETPDVEVRRLAGTDRVATAIALSQDAFAEAGNAFGVVVAAADRPTDALVGVPLAAAHRAPLLLTPGDRLAPEVAAEVERLLGDGGGPVLLMGGTSALSADVELALGGSGRMVQRVAGADRFATAAAVAERLGPPGTVLLATGRRSADALAAGAAAADAGGIVLLTDGPTMPVATQSVLDTLPEGARVFAVGGDAATAAPDAEAVAGEDRYETARLVAERFFVTPSLVGLANGHRTADALAGASHAALFGGPLLLTPAESLAEAALAWFPERRAFLEQVVLYGGTAALTAAVERDAEDAATG